METFARAAMLPDNVKGFDFLFSGFCSFFSDSFIWFLGFGFWNTYFEI